MQPTFLGKVTVTTAGTAVPLITDPAIRACKILFFSIPGLTGSVYVGGAGLNQSTLAAVMIKFNAPGTAGESGYFELGTEDGRNSLRVCDYYVGAAVSGEGLLVTYFQE